MTYYLFYQPGHIPGKPGIYNNCRVDVADDGTVTQSPLPALPHDMATTQPEVQAEQGVENLPGEPMEAPLVSPAQEEQPVEPAPSAETTEGQIE